MVPPKTQRGAGASPAHQDVGSGQGQDCGRLLPLCSRPPEGPAVSPAPGHLPDQRGKTGFLLTPPTLSKHLGNMGTERWPAGATHPPILLPHPGQTQGQLPPLGLANPTLSGARESQLGGRDGRGEAGAHPPPRTAFRLQPREGRSCSGAMSRARRPPSQNVAGLGCSDTGQDTGSLLLGRTRDGLEGRLLRTWCPGKALPSHVGTPLLSRGAEAGSRKQASAPGSGWGWGDTHTLPVPEQRPDHPVFAPRNDTALFTWTPLRWACHRPHHG